MYVSMCSVTAFILLDILWWIHESHKTDIKANRLQSWDGGGLDELEAMQLSSQPKMVGNICIYSFVYNISVLE